MTNFNWKNTLYNLCLALNCLLIFWSVFGAQLNLPTWLQVAGRMHPLALHFPIVLPVVAGAWEYFNRSKNNAAGDALLLASALTAGIAALMGFMLSREGDYGPDALRWHQWSGVGVSVLAFLWYTFRVPLRQSNRRIGAVAALSVGILLLAGHEGATLTHGAGYLWAPAQPVARVPAVGPEVAEIYAHVVQPILKEKCMNCHNGAKSKGELIMETEAQLLKGGKNGPLWDTAAADLGLLMQRVHLPMDEKEHMPPAGKPQLTEQEILILQYWIKDGASFTKKVTDLPEGHPLKTLAKERLDPKEEERYDFDPADEHTIQKLNNEYRTVYPLALKSPALCADFFGAQAFKSEHLQELLAVKNQLVQLNLNKMPLQDIDLKQIAQFTNLRQLNLTATSITGTMLGELRPLKALRKLSLAGTAVNASDLSALQGLPDLRDLYIWNTGVSTGDLQTLRLQLPKVRISTGFRGDTIEAQLNAAIIEGGEQLFKTATKVRLKNYIRGAIVRYTLDGSVPDSLNSPLSNGDSITVDKTCILTTKTFMQGWISSEPATKSFYKVGLTPDSAWLSLPPNPQYVGTGAKGLIDLKIGDTDFRSNKWLGFRENPMVAWFWFQEPTTLSSISLSTVVDISSYILPAQRIEIWGGPSAKQLSLLKTLTPEQPNTVVPGYRIGFHGKFTPRKVQVVKIVGKPVGKLPAWHPGQGQPGWLFVDEVFWE